MGVGGTAWVPPARRRVAAIRLGHGPELAGAELNTSPGEGHVFASASSERLSSSLAARRVRGVHQVFERALFVGAGVVGRMLARVREQASCLRFVLFCGWPSWSSWLHMSWELLTRCLLWAWLRGALALRRSEVLRRNQVGSVGPIGLVVGLGRLVLGWCLVFGVWFWSVRLVVGLVGVGWSGWCWSCWFSWLCCGECRLVDVSVGRVGLVGRVLRSGGWEWGGLVFLVAVVWLVEFGDLAPDCLGLSMLVAQSVFVMSASWISETISFVEMSNLIQFYSIHRVFY